MARRSRRSKDPVTRAAQTVALPWTLKSEVDAFVRPAARVAGAAGIAMLAGCGVLAATPREEWPAWLSPERLPVYVMVSLAVASLLGWTFVSDGQSRIRRRLGARVSLWAFVVLPISFAILGLVGAGPVSAVGGPAPSHWFWRVVRWYGPVLVVVSLVAFLTWKSRGRYGRGAWFVLLITPYAALFADLVLHLRVAALEEAHGTAVRALGSWAVTLQLALAFFVGGD
jgi:hypothetical protein